MGADFSATEKVAESSTGFFQLPLWQLAFRSSFLFATVASMIAMLTWIAALNGWWQRPYTGLTPVVWHLHEALFGFAATVAVGFALTAVQTWTGLRSLHGKWLALLMMIWLTARIGFWLNTPQSLYFAVTAQMLWWILAIVCFTKLLFEAKNQRNYLLVGVFSFMAMLNLLLLAADLQGYSNLALHSGRTMVLMFTLLMTIIGGRVIPFFTERGARLSRVQHPEWLNKALISSSVLTILFFAVSQFINMPYTVSFLLIITGMLHLIRLSYWRSQTSLKYPLLWSLHLSYLMMAMGLIALGVSYLTTFIAFSSALHFLTIGAMGLMIFAMMSRVSLGHTDRPLTPSPIMSFAFGLVVVAAVIRSTLPGFGYYHLALNISALLWIVSGLMFLWVYTPILVSARR